MPAVHPARRRRRLTTEEVVVALRNPAGLHARAAAAVAREARRFQALVTVTNLDRAVGAAANARSVLALLGLAARAGDRLAVLGDGPDAAVAARAVAAVLEGPGERAE